MERTNFALIPAPVAGSARPCARRHGYVWLGNGSLCDSKMRFTEVNTKPSARWSRRHPI